MLNLTDQWGVAQAGAMSAESAEQLLYLGDDILQATSVARKHVKRHEAKAGHSGCDDGNDASDLKLSVRRVTRAVVDAWNEPGARALVYIVRTSEGEEYFELASGAQ